MAVVIFTFDFNFLWWLTDNWKHVRVMAMRNAYKILLKEFEGKEQAET